MIDLEAELAQLAVAAETEAKIDLLAKRLERENGAGAIAAYQMIEIERAEAEGREPILM